MLNEWIKVPEMKMKKPCAYAIVIMLQLFTLVSIIANYRELFVPGELVMRGFETAVEPREAVLAGVAAWYYGARYVFELFCAVSFAVVFCAVLAVSVRAGDSKKVLLFTNVIMACGVFFLAVLTIAEKSDLVLKPVLRLFAKITGFSGEGAEHVQDVRNGMHFFGECLPVLLLVMGMLFLSFVISLRRKEGGGTGVRLMPVCLAVTVMAGVQWLLKQFCMGNLFFFQSPADVDFESANAAVDEIRCLFILPVILMAAAGCAVWLREKKRDMKFRGVAFSAVSCVLVLTYAEWVCLYLYGRREVVDGVFFYKTSANEVIVSVIWGMGLFYVFCIYCITGMLFHKVSAAGIVHRKGI